MVLYFSSSPLLGDAATVTGCSGPDAAFQAIAQNLFLHPCAIRTNGPHGDSMAESKFGGAVKEGQRDQGFDKSRGTPTDAADLAYS